MDRPSLDLVRSATDELVLRALMDRRRLTRAELAAQVGVSKPTASQSVRRLAEAGLLRDSGARTTGRGRIGTYYEIPDDVGVGLAVQIAPEAVVAEAVTLHGEVVARAERIPGRPQQVRTALRRVGREALLGHGAARLAVVSAAEPVDRATGRLVQLPDLPFLVGALDPVQVLSDCVSGPVVVDNDVNWAARAERQVDRLDDFVYLYLGVGAGAAVVSDGEVRRGHAGLAGEIMHLLTVGPGGRAMPFIHVFAESGLTLRGTTAMDVPRIGALLDAASGPDVDVVVDAVAGLVPAAVALTDPAAVVLGGPWGVHERLVELVAARVAALPRPVPVRRARVDAEPALTGARAAAIDLVRTSLTDLVRA